MSAPGDSGPTQGYYPDPSIPGYIRYWDGTAWVPGTSRPAPSEGAPAPAPPAEATGPGVQPAPSEQPPIDSTQQAGPLPDQTGPVFFDEQPAAGGLRGALPELRPRGEVDVRADAQGHGAAPTGETGAVPWYDPQQGPGAPAGAGGWYADASHQAGFGGDADQRVSWGAEDAAGRPIDPATAAVDPRVVPPTGIGPTPSARRAPGPPTDPAPVRGPQPHPHGRPHG
ncbi:DUF2510 domain-containing protein, partial [Streptomyces sp. HSW2009]|uniref:DUF2510 domain-containing protein n=1 Tax=Streptomyces sp. HSW2009 TaxID=3142890 RepID=UPI0032EACD72